MLLFYIVVVKLLFWELPTVKIMSAPEAFTFFASKPAQWKNLHTRKRQRIEVYCDNAEVYCDNGRQQASERLRILDMLA